MAPHRLRFHLVNSERSWSARQRRRRADWLAQTFPDLRQMHVIDLGGRLGTWTRAAVRPARVHVVNLEQPPPEVPEWAEADRRWPLGHKPTRSHDAIHQVLWTELLDRSQMRHYFPDSRILVERLAGLPKSLIAVRAGGS